MKHVHSLALFVILFATSFVSCGDNDNEPKIGITGYSWTEGKPVEISMGSSLTLTFEANANWTASASSTWCTLLNNSGKEGKSTLQLLVTTASKTERTATVTIKVEGYSSTSFQVIQKASSETSTEDMEINGKVNQYLREMYLWNDEYNTLDFDFTKGYEDFFYDALMGMTTNTLDNKLTSNNQHTLFSYIEKRNIISPTRSTKLVDKELEYSFGIVGVSILSFSSGSCNFCVQGVYPDSPAALAGIKRGMLITQINGTKLTSANYANYYYDLLFPGSSFSLKLLESVSETESKETTITSQAMYKNPVLFKQVKGTGGHKIGYLVYSGFEAGFDGELFDAFKYFKGENVTDLILDLRYNGGGYTISANLIASCIAGAASEGKVFTNYRYNETRMEKSTEEQRRQLFLYSNYANLGTSLSAGGLGLTHIYCLVGKGTASASELVINALRGIDVEVTLIGEQTVGKNVGMEFEDMTVRDNAYRIVPITFQTYNAKGFGDYETGFTPDKLIDEKDPYNETNVFYRYREYGSDEEFLYAAALEMITGRASAGTRGMESPINAKVQEMPAIFRPGHDGMLKSTAE